MARPTVLLVDDEESVPKVLTYPLGPGRPPRRAGTGRRGSPGALPSRVGQPRRPRHASRLDGLAVCRRLREERSRSSSAHRSRRRGDKVFGLELGADDYITKPFSIREFMSRVLRSSGGRQLPPAGTRTEVLDWTGSGSTSPGAPSRRGARGPTAYLSSSSSACWRRAPAAFSAKSAARRALGWLRVP